MLELSFFCNLQSDKLTTRPIVARPLRDWGVGPQHMPSGPTYSCGICIKCIRNFWVSPQIHSASSYSYKLLITRNTPKSTDLNAILQTFSGVKLAHSTLVSSSPGRRSILSSILKSPKRREHPLHHDTGAPIYRGAPKPIPDLTPITQQYETPGSALEYHP